MKCKTSKESRVVEATVLLSTTHGEGDGSQGKGITHRCTPICYNGMSQTNWLMVVSRLSLVDDGKNRLATRVVSTANLLQGGCHRQSGSWLSIGWWWQNVNGLLYLEKNSFSPNLDIFHPPHPWSASIECHTEKLPYGCPLVDYGKIWTIYLPRK